VLDQKKELEVTIDASEVISAFNVIEREQIFEAEKREKEEAAKKAVCEREASFKDKLRKQLTSPYELRTWYDYGVWYKGKKVIENETFEQLYNDFTEGKHLEKVAEIDAAEKESKALPGKVKSWIQKNGSELAQLRVKHNFEYMHLAGVEHARQLIAENEELKDMETMCKSFYDSLTVLDEDYAPTIGMLRDMDRLHDHPLADNISLETNDDSGNVYLIFRVKVVSEVSIYLFRKY
jgi:hypothetical protein